MGGIGSSSTTLQFHIDTVEHNKLLFMKVHLLHNGYASIIEFKISALVGEYN